MVVAELHDQHAEVAEQLDALELVRQHRGGLERENHRDLLLGLGAFEVGVAPDLDEMLRVALDQCLRGGNVGHGLLERAVGAAQRGLQRGDAGIGKRLEPLRVLELASDGFERIAIEHEGIAVDVGAVHSSC